MQIIIDLHAAVDARVKVCPVLVLAAHLIFRTLGSLRDGLAALVGRIPGSASPRRRKRRPQAAPAQSANTASASTADGTAASESPESADTASASACAATASATTATDAKAKAKARVRKSRRWPSKYRAIADFIGDDATAIAARLRALLADPAAIAYIRANPEFARLLRPLCRGFRVRLIPELRRKPASRFDEALEETPYVEPEPEPEPAPGPASAAASPAPATEPAPLPPSPPPPPPPPAPPPVHHYFVDANVTDFTPTHLTRRRHWAW